MSKFPLEAFIPVTFCYLPFLLQMLNKSCLSVVKRAVAVAHVCKWSKRGVSRGSYQRHEQCPASAFCTCLLHKQSLHGTGHLSPFTELRTF